MHIPIKHYYICVSVYVLSHENLSIEMDVYMCPFIHMRTSELKYKKKLKDA